MFVCFCFVFNFKKLIKVKISYIIDKLIIMIPQHKINWLNAVKKRDIMLSLKIFLLFSVL